MFYDDLKALTDGFENQLDFLNIGKSADDEIARILADKETELIAKDAIIDGLKSEIAEMQKTNLKETSESTKESEENGIVEDEVMDLEDLVEALKKDEIEIVS